MCRAGGRRCPGQYDPAKAAARNAQRRANYAAKKGNGGSASPAQASTADTSPKTTPQAENITLTGKALQDEEFTVSPEEDAEYERRNAKERADMERDAVFDASQARNALYVERTKYNAAMAMAEKKGDDSRSKKATAEHGPRIKELEQNLEQAQKRLKDIQDVTKRRLDQVAITGYPGQAKEMRAEIKPSIDAEKAKVKEAKEALKVEKAAEKEAKKVANAESVTATPAPKATGRRAIAPESSSNGYEYKNSTPAPEEMRRSLPAGVPFKDAVAPGDYVRHLDDYVKVDSYSETDHGITINEGQGNEMFIPRNDLYDEGKVLLRSRPGTNDGAGYDESSRFDEPELRGDSGYSTSDYDDLYGEEPQEFPEDDFPEEDFDDLGDPYGDRDYGDDY